LLRIKLLRFEHAIVLNKRLWVKYFFTFQRARVHKGSLASKAKPIKIIANFFLFTAKFVEEMLYYRIMYTIKKYLKIAANYLKNNNIENATFEVQVITANYLKLQRYELITKEDMQLNPVQIIILNEQIRSKATHCPTAYIINKKEFFLKEFYVDKNVLIPRPETEELVEYIIEDFKNNNFGLNIIDLGTGCGCIGLPLANHLRINKIILSDISKKSLVIARKNAQNNINKNKIFFLHSDLYKSFSNNCIAKADIIVSNPPYITKEEYIHLDFEVKNFEPKKALLVTNPYDFFNSFFSQAKIFLKDSGYLYLETNPNLVTMQTKLLDENGFKNITVLKDLSNKNRFIKAFS